MNSEQAVALLKVMYQDLTQQDALYQPTAFWRQASDSIYHELCEYGFAQFRALPTPLSYFVPTYGPPGNALTLAQAQRLEQAFLQDATAGSKNHLTLMHMLKGEMWALADYRVAMAGDRCGQAPDLHKISESATGSPVEQFCFDGRFYSRSLLNYILGLVFLKQHVDTSTIRNVLEVGGGFGSLGEILHKGGDYAYVNIDIPPTAAVSSYYLSALSGANLSSYLETRHLAAIDFPKLNQQMVICPWQLPALQGAVDLFVNFISFQEMEPHVVQNYLQHVDRLKCRYVLLRNLSEGKQQKTSADSGGVETPITSAHYDSFMPNYSLVASNVIPFGYKTIDGFHSELRLYQRID